MCLCLCLFFFSFKDQEHTFNWEDLTNWEADDEAMAFCFEYSKGGKKPRWVKIYSQYVRRYVELSAWLALERERERKRGFPSTKKSGESAKEGRSPRCRACPLLFPFLVPTMPTNTEVFLTY